MICDAVPTRSVTIPAEDLARLPVVPGQRVRVRVEQVPSEPGRSHLGALVKPGRPVVTLDDFDAVSDAADPVVPGAVPLVIRP